MELKPCPFCGGEPMERICNDNKIILCKGCSASTGFEHTIEKAIEKWQKRTNEIVKEVADKDPCETCYYDNNVDEDCPYCGNNFEGYTPKIDDATNEVVGAVARPDYSKEDK